MFVMGDSISHTKHNLASIKFSHSTPLQLIYSLVLQLVWTEIWKILIFLSFSAEQVDSILRLGNHLARF